MDANGTRFYLLTGDARWERLLGSLERSDSASSAGTVPALRLPSLTDAPDLHEDGPRALALREACPGAIDPYGAEAWVEGNDLLVQLSSLSQRQLYTAATPPSSVCLSTDGLIAIAVGGKLQIRDSRSLGDAREDWQEIDPTRLGMPALDAWRVSPASSGGFWVMDRAHRRLWHFVGSLLRSRPKVSPAPGVFKLSPEDPQTWTIRPLHSAEATEEWLGLAAGPSGRVALLLRRPGEDVRLRLLDAEGATTSEQAVKNVRHPYALGWADTERVALLCTHDDDTELLVYQPTGSGTLLPVGEKYPRRQHSGGPFVVSPDGLARYPTPNGPADLIPLSLPHRPTFALASGPPVDSGAADTCWHRLFVEAAVPEGCGLRFWLATSPDGIAPHDADLWQPHHLGELSPTRIIGQGNGSRSRFQAPLANAPLKPGSVKVTWTSGGNPQSQVADLNRHFTGDGAAENSTIDYNLGALQVDLSGAPPDDGTAVEVDYQSDNSREARLVWHLEASEVPGDDGRLLRRIPHRSGLFSTLIQRRGRRSARLYGRFLHIRVELHGNGRFSPELLALRAWGSRFSYVREYLPELYHEHPALDGAEDAGRPTGADFLERFVSLFEGFLTPLEDKVADAWIYTSPQAAPLAALDGLASWLGRSLDPALPEKARRKMVELAPQLSQWRGTRRGLELALETVSDGGVSRGEVIVVEEWRLRRTWATILGADLANEQDPLLEGLVISGNSLVGDTLFLGDEHHREFMALFADKSLNAADKAAVRAFYQDSAWRVTVLLSEHLDLQMQGLLRRTVASEVPAHLIVDVKIATRSFVAGVSALVGVDTRIGVDPGPQTVRLGRSRLGTGDRIRRPASLHPDMEGEGG